LFTSLVWLAVAPQAALGQVQPGTSTINTGNTGSVLPTSSSGETKSSSQNINLDPGPAQTIKAHAGDDIQGIVGEEMIFNAGGSTVPENQTVQYIWSVDSQTQLEGQQVQHIYKRAGTYTVTLTISSAGQVSKDFLQVSVFDKSIVLLTDNVTSQDQILELQRQAERSGKLLTIIEDRESKTDFTREDKLSDLLLKQVKAIESSDILVDWTTGDTGLNALSNFAQSLKKTENQIDFSKKVIVSLASPIGVVARIAQSTFDVISPQYLILTVPTALDAVIESGTADQVLGHVQQTGSELRLIGEFSGRSVKKLTPLNFMSFLVNFMINRGVPVNSIMLLLMLPIIAMFFAFARQVIGLRAFGIYIPTIVTLSFLALGLTYGLTIFFLVLIVGTLLRFLIKKLRISYIPRLALVLTGITFAIIGLLAVGELVSQPNITALAIFPILIMVALTEQFVAAQIEQGFSTAVLLTTETLVLAVAAYLLVSWDLFQSLILAYPEIIFLTIIINLLLGRWTGLRLIEYYRFRQVRRFSKLP